MPADPPDRTDDVASRRPVRPAGRGFVLGQPGKWVAVAGVAVVLVMVAIVVVVLLVDRSRDEERRAAADAAASGTVVTSPYDLLELPGNVDLSRVKDAAFVSISVPDESGTLTSYGMSVDLPDVQVLVKAITKAEGLDPEVATTELAGATPDGTLTFVLPTRETLTFALYLEPGLIARDTAVWRPDADLKALVQTAIAGPE